MRPLDMSICVSGCACVVLMSCLDSPLPALVRLCTRLPSVWAELKVEAGRSTCRYSLASTLDSYKNTRLVLVSRPTFSERGAGSDSEDGVFSLVSPRRSSRQEEHGNLPNNTAYNRCVTTVVPMSWLMIVPFLFPLLISQDNQVPRSMPSHQVIASRNLTLPLFFIMTETSLYSQLTPLVCDEPPRRAVQCGMAPCRPDAGPRGCS